MDSFTGHAAYHSHPEGGSAYVEETVDCVRTRTLDADLLVYDVAAHYKAVKTALQTEIVDRADALLQSVGAEYGAMERIGWDQQYAEAQAYQADSAAPAPMLTGLAVARGVDLADLAARVIANRETWEATYIAVIGTRQAYQDKLSAAVAIYEAAEDDDARAAAIAAIEAISVEYTLPSGDG